MEKKKKVKKKHTKFNDFNGYGIYHIIFSYISNNKDVIHFAYVSKMFFEIFKMMKERSLNHDYQYRFLTNQQNRKDYSFDIFSPGKSCLMHFKLDKELYCTTFEEYIRDRLDEYATHHYGKNLSKVNKYDDEEEEENGEDFYNNFDLDLGNLIDLVYAEKDDEDTRFGEYGEEEEHEEKDQLLEQNESCIIFW